MFVHTESQDSLPSPPRLLVQNLMHISGEQRRKTGKYCYCDNMHNKQCTDLVEFRSKYVSVSYSVQIWNEAQCLGSHELDRLLDTSAQTWAYNNAIPHVPTNIGLHLCWSDPVTIHLLITYPTCRLLNRIFLSGNKKFLSPFESNILGRPYQFGVRICNSLVIPDLVQKNGCYE